MKTNDKPSLDDLAAAWRRQNERLERVAGQYPVDLSQVDFDARRASPRRRLLAATLLRSLACFAALAWLASLYRRYVVDVWDLVPHLIAGLLLLCNGVSNLRLFVLLLWRRMAVPPTVLRRYAEANPPLLRGGEARRPTLARFSLRYSRVAAVAALVVVGFVAYTPTYDGRTASVADADTRGAVVTHVDRILVNTANTPMA